MPKREEGFEKILKAARARVPFRPITICLENGERYRVAHPEGIMMAGGWVVVELPRGNPPMTWFPLDAVSAVAGGGNGRAV